MDHMHPDMIIPPKHSVSRVVETVKSVTNRRFEREIFVVPAEDIHGQ